LLPNLKRGVVEKEGEEEGYNKFMVLSS
jgi:hypothetical protein